MLFLIISNYKFFHSPLTKYRYNKHVLFMLCEMKTISDKLTQLPR